MKITAARLGALTLGIAGLVAVVPSTSHAASAGSNPAEVVDTSGSAQSIAQQLVGPGVAVSNVQFTGSDLARGTFTFNDPSVLGMSSGVILGTGNANEVVGPNTSDSNSTDFGLPGDADLSALAGYDTHDAAILSFDFVPTTNQVAFQYAFGSDEYPEWVNTQYNDVFAFWVTDGTGTTNNCAQVRQVVGDPTSPLVPVAVNNINQSNPVQSPPPTAMRPDLFRPNYVDPSGAPSAIDLELDGITKTLTCQSAVTPGVVNHMRLAIADSGDGIYDSAVFLKAASLVSNPNPTDDFGLDPSTGPAPLTVTAGLDAHDPNGLPLSYSIDWGDGSSTGSVALAGGTGTVGHTYQYAGTYAAVATVSDGTYITKSCDEAVVTGAPNPAGPVNQNCDAFATGGGTGSGGLAVVTSTLPAGTHGHGYAANLQASGGHAPYKWTLAPGSAPLPPGMKLAASGKLGGKPTTSGTWSFTVQVTDKKTATKPHTQNTATKNVSLTVG
jgi:hypothetical protein